MATQTLLDLVTKLPLSAVPRFGGKTRPIKQTEIQAEGCWRVGDPHPLYEGLYFRDLNKNKAQRWQTAEQREAEVAQTYKYERENKHVRQAYNERNAERISKKSAQYYKDNWEKKRKYRDSRKDERAAYHNKYYENNKGYYRSKNTRRRAALKENIKLNKVQKKAMEEIHNLRMDLDLAAVGAGEFPEGYNGQTRWSFELHHLSPLLEYKDLYCGLDAPWNVEILSIREHQTVHTRVLPSER